MPETPTCLPNWRPPVEGEMEFVCALGQRRSTCDRNMQIGKQAARRRTGQAASRCRLVFLTRKASWGTYCRPAGWASRCETDAADIAACRLDARERRA